MAAIDFKDVIKKISKDLTQSFAALVLVGFVAYSIIDLSEAIFGYLVKIGAILINTSTEIYYYLQFVPQVIFIGIWTYVVFILLNGFNGDLNLNLSKNRKLAIRFGLLALTLYILNFYLSLQAEVIYLTYYMEEPLVLYKDDQRSSGQIMAILGLIKMAIIIVGFLRALAASPFLIILRALSEPL